MATYSVTPGQVAPYFSKIQCFCFEEQRLNAGETVDMPVFFYIDPDFVSDPNMKGIEQLTLSYTFFSKSSVGLRDCGWIDANPRQRQSMIKMGISHLCQYKCECKISGFNFGIGRSLGEWYLEDGA